jgi:hypothetical protein
VSNREVVWLLLSVLAATIPVALSRRIVERALARGERSDFLKAGDPRRWAPGTLTQLPGPVGDFVREWTREPDAACRVDTVCERLAAVDVQTTRVGERLKQLARMDVAAGMLISIAMLSSAVSRSDGKSGVWSLVPVLASAVSAFSIQWIGRVASVAVAERRRAWDALCQVLIPPHMSGPRGGVRSPAHRDDAPRQK